MSLPSPKNLNIEIVDVVKVFDLNADVPGLDMTFDGTSLKASKQALSVYTLRFYNSGKEGIQNAMYDFNQGIGVEWKSGKVFPPQVLTSSQSYLRDNLKPRLEGTNKIRFEPVSIDGGAYFVVQALVLHAEGIEPKLVPIGKITNIDFDQIPVVDLRAPSGIAAIIQKASPPLTAFLLGVVLALSFVLVISIPILKSPLRKMNRMLELQALSEKVYASQKIVLDKVLFTTTERFNNYEKFAKAKLNGEEVDVSVLEKENNELEKVLMEASQEYLDRATEYENVVKSALEKR